MKRAIGRIPVFSIISLLLLAGVIVLWARSRRHADLVGFYTPAGHLCGFNNDRTGLLVFSSDIPFGQEMGLSADSMSASAEDFAPIHDLLFDPTNVKHKFLGFQSAAAPIGSWGWKFSAWVVPYWALILPLTILPLLRVRGFLVRRRRARRGQCLACGYDLRHSQDRCPECGTPIGENAPPKPADGEASAGSVGIAGMLPWILLVATVTGAGGLLHRGRHAAAQAAVAPPEIAFADRPVRQIDPSAQSAGDVKHWATPQAIYVGAAAAPPRIVRSYPVADLLNPRILTEEEAVRATAHLTTYPSGGNQGAIVNSYFPLRKALPDLILSMVLEDQHSVAGGSPDDGMVLGDRLWVCQTQEGH
jgi:hypothetical protein